jgi:hypothetical protein
MKKTLWTTAAALVAAAALVTVLVPRAEASSPKTKFAAVKKALLAKQAQANVTLEFLTPGGKGKPGPDIEMKAGSFDFQGGGLIIIDPEHADLSHLSAEERSKIEAMMQKALADGGTSGAEAWVNGEKVSIEEAQRLMKEYHVDLNVSTTSGGDLEFRFGFNFDEGSYSAMSFGSNENTLLLTPKKSKNTRYSLSIDPKTNLPFKVTLQSSKNGKWADVSKSQFHYQVKLKKS